ncbi:hypothetical protein [Paraferrimonas haliotis]|uniref:hypothetical protein n=1 Tax=Paraferrimonas haliotis TaxID=2013866 RepID=UPI000BA9401A|nr:hypothetical protein [Paraferrimonas haliotis]
MRNKTTILTSQQSVAESVRLWLLDSYLDSDSLSWNSNRIGFVAKKLNTLFECNYYWLENLSTLSDFFCKKTTDSKHSRMEFCNSIGFFTNLGHECYSTVTYLISLMFLHLSEQGHVVLRYGHQIKLPPAGVSFLKYYKLGLVPKLIAELYAMSTNSRFNSCKGLLNAKCIDELEKIGSETSSTRQRSLLNTMEVASYFGISSINEFDTDMFYEYFCINEVAEGSTLSFLFFLNLYDKVYDGKLSDEWGSTIKHHVSAVKSNASTSKIKIIDQPGLVRASTNSYINAEEVELQHEEKTSNFLKFGSFEFNVKSKLTDFSPDKLEQESYWKKTQCDFVNSFSESGTKKSQKLRLSYLNSYLFDYLPQFFSSKIDLPYPRPISPKYFYPYIYIKPSETLIEHAFGKEVGVELPVSLLDYIYTITEEKALLQGSHRTNAGRDCISLIQRYFDFLISKFSSIPECRIDSNPITDWDKNSRAGYNLSGTNKEILELDYWVFLRDYIKLIANVLVENAENVVFHGKDNKFIFKIDKYISWRNFKVHIDEVDLTELGEFAFQDNKNPVYTTAFQGFVSLYVLAWTGMRDSNALWLDVRSFDSLVSESFDDDDLVELFVNTDKIKTSPFKIQIPSHVMKLLQRVKELRLEVDRNGFNEPIDYKGAATSKWGKVKPLLQATKKNGSPYSSKRNLLLFCCRTFENFLEAHNKTASEKDEATKLISYTSSIYYLPLKANQKTFRQNTNTFHRDQDYTWVIKYLKSDYECTYTPIKEAVTWTPHSLRATFDSIMSLLVDPKEVGEISTGQSEGVVGYYAQMKLSEAKKVRRLGCNLVSENKLPMQVSSATKVLSAKDESVDEKAFKIFHSQGKAAEQFGCISLSHIEVSNNISPLEALKNASSQQLAFNRTHICPFNNDCPKEVISLLNGQKNCSICPYALFCKDHAVGISAELKRLGDISAEVSKKIEHPNLFEREKQGLKRELNYLIQAIAGWYARHVFLAKKINSEEFFTGKADEKLIVHVKSSSLGENLLNRLVESHDVPTLQSEKLKRSAAQITRKIKALLRTSPDVFIAESNEADELSVALQMIKTICEFNNIEVGEIMEALASPQAINVKWLEAINE